MDTALENTAVLSQAGQVPVPVTVTPRPWFTNDMQTAINTAMTGIILAAGLLVAAWLHSWQVEFDTKQQMGHEEVVKAVGDAKAVIDAKPVQTPPSPTLDPTLAEVLRQIRLQNDATAASLKALELKLSAKEKQ